MLQTLNILENFDLKSMGYDSARYIHTLYQAMNLAYADRDFYYGDPAFSPHRRSRDCSQRTTRVNARSSCDPDHNDPDIRPGDPYPYRGRQEPVILDTSGSGTRPCQPDADHAWRNSTAPSASGTTSVEAADEQGLGGFGDPERWLGAGGDRRPHRHRPEPAHADLRARPTREPLQRARPGKRPRATLTPSLALKDGKPYLVFSVQGGDTQDQNLLQFFLNIVEFGMSVQEATEAANITSYQLRDSFGAHQSFPGRLTVNSATPAWVRKELTRMGYALEFEERSSGPINAIFVDQAHGTLWGGSSNHGEDYGIGW